MTDYDLMCRQLESLSGGVSWDMTVLSNAAALVWDSLDDINWAGFYLMKEGKRTEKIMDEVEQNIMQTGTSKTYAKIHRIEEDKEDYK